MSIGGDGKFINPFSAGGGGIYDWSASAIGGAGNVLNQAANVYSCGYLCRNAAG